MKNKMFRVLSAAAVSAALLTLTACAKTGSSSSKEVALVFLNGENNPYVTAAGMEDVPELTSALDGGQITLVQADGDPAVENLKFDPVKKGNQQQHNLNRQNLQQALVNAGADDPETDLVQAFQQTARTGIKEIVVAHSGLSTAGAVCFQNLDLENTDEIPALIRELDEHGELAQLQGTQIHWFYAGDVQSPQNKLSAKQRDFVKVFWKAYLEACGASVSFPDDLPEEYETPTDAPAVTVVETGEAYTLPSVTAIDPQAVAFKSDSTELADEAAARAALSALAEQLAGTTDAYYVSGFTADDGSSLQATKEFGLARAKEVKKLLCEADPNLSGRLTAIGLGVEPVSLRSSNENDNRVVYLIKADTDVGKELAAAGIREVG